MTGASVKLIDLVPDATTEMIQAALEKTGRLDHIENPHIRKCVSEMLRSQFFPAANRAPTTIYEHDLDMVLQEMQAAVSE